MLFYFEKYNTFVVKNTCMQKQQDKKGFYSIDLETTHVEHIYRLGDDVILTDGLDLDIALPPNFRATNPTIVLLEQGELHGRTNLRELHLKAPCMAIILPNDILEIASNKPAIGKALLLSVPFAEQLNIFANYDLYRSIRVNPVITLSDEAYQSMQQFFNMVRNALIHEDNPYRQEMLLALLRAYYYGAGYYFHLAEKQTARNRNDRIVEQFLELVHVHSQHERRLNFYAEKMCISCKYMANVVSEHTGKSAGQWIQEHVILEAKMLLRSGLTVWAVADMLHFPDQSSFGKYFRRATGISPKQFSNQA